MRGNMDPMMWKDIEMIKQRKGLTLILPSAIGLGVAVVINYATAIMMEGDALLDFFNRNFSYLSIVFPILMAYYLFQNVVLSEVEERSIEALLATPLSVRRILLNKAFLISIISWGIWVIDLFISLVVSWFIFYHSVIFPSLSAFINLLIAPLLLFGVFGLICVGFWIIPNKNTPTILLGIVFLGAIFLLDFMLYIPYSNWVSVILFVTATLFAVLFYVMTGRVKKEKVALARL